MDYTEAIRLALEGEQRGYTVLYEKTYQKKYFLALQYMKNEDAAEDVMQEAYIRAFSKLDTLKKPEKFPGWFGMIVANTAKNALRKNSPMLFSDLAADEKQEELEYLIEDDNIDHIPERAYTRKETKQLAHRMLNSLSEEQRICILMFHIEGLSIRQIASALGCSENTIKSRLKYGRDNIKAKGEELQKKGYELYSVAPLPLLLYLLRKEAAYMKTDGSLRAAGERIAEHVIPFSGKKSNTGVSRKVQKSGGRPTKVVKSGFIHTAAGKVTVALAVLCLIGGAAAYGAWRLNTNEKPVGREAEKEAQGVEEKEPETKKTEDPPAVTVKELQDTEYGTLIAGNLTKAELQFVLAYGPQEIPEQGFQEQDYLHILNSLCDASGINEGEPMVEYYGMNPDLGNQYSVSDVNRLFRSFTDYQLVEGISALSGHNVRVQGEAVIFLGASTGKTANAVITSANYTEEEMEIYYTCNYATTDMAREGIPEKIEHRKAVLKPNTEGMYQIIRIEVIEEQTTAGQATEGQVPEEQMPNGQATEGQMSEPPMENVGFPVGSFSYAASAGGGRGSLTIDPAGVATYVEFSSGTGKGSEIKYQMVVDGTAAVSDGVTAYSLQFIEGNEFQMTGSGREVTGYLESGDSKTFYYDANQGTLQDVWGTIWAPAG